MVERQTPWQGGAPLRVPPHGDSPFASYGSAMPLLEVRDLRKLFPIRRGVFGKTVGNVHAVDGVSFDLDAGSALGLVGESGCGKTTLGRCLLRLIEPTSGSVRLDGTDFLSLSAGALRPFRRHAQMIFQDPYGSLNPRLTVGEILSEPLLVHRLADRAGAEQQAGDLLERVGLTRAHLGHYPHQFSGGQRQRIGIARALALKPKLIVCDEPVSALDVSVQAQVLNLLKDLQRDFGIAYLFISHDLAVVSHLCPRVAVMYLGEIVEIGPAQQLLTQPLHPYTQALLSAVPRGEPGQQHQRIILPGDPPSPLEPSSAKRFTTRFPQHAAAFTDGDIALREVEPGHLVRCARLDVLRDLAAQGEAAWR